MRLLQLCCLLSLLSPSVSAKDMASLYDHATLVSWQNRYAEGILWNIENVIWPRLDKFERQQLAGARFCFPIYGQRRDPLEFYVGSDSAMEDPCAHLAPPVITLPILSIKFFDDLSVAHAWLSRNLYSPETALEYAAMLKYGDEAQFGGRYPEPLKPLRIPPEALDDPVVEEQAQQLLKSAIVFLTLHELGHLLHRHAGYESVSAATAQSNEREADSFALEMMRRIGVVPYGILFWFETAAYMSSNRGDFSNDAEYQDWLSRTTHPVTEDRLSAIAANLRQSPEDFALEFPDPATGTRAVLTVAHEIDRIAGFMGDLGVQRLIAQRGRRTQVTGLAPRRHGELLGIPSQGEAGNVAFDGVYDGEVTVGVEVLPIRTVLYRKGDHVTGQYSYGAGQGRLSGTVRESGLEFSWEEGAEGGRGRLEMAPDGAGFTGAWGNGASHTGGGTWTGRRLQE